MSMDNIKIFWDDVNKIPRILNEINDMELITKEKLRYLAPDLRPVFYQEKKLLRLLFDELDEKNMYFFLIIQINRALILNYFF